MMQIKVPDLIQIKHRRDGPAVLPVAPENSVRWQSAMSAHRLRRALSLLACSHVPYLFPEMNP
jgi:hypothetical protein